MYQVAFVNDKGFFDVDFVEEADLESRLASLYKEQVKSIAKDYCRVDMNDFTYKEGEWEVVMSVNGVMISRDSAIELEGVGWIPKSDLAYYEKCDRCGKYHPKHALVNVEHITTGEVESICGRCLEKLVDKKVVGACNSCHKYFFIEEGCSFHKIGDVLLCDDCYERKLTRHEIKRCEMCGREHFAYSLHYSVDDKFVCNDCDPIDYDVIKGYQHNHHLTSLYVRGESNEDMKKMIGIELEIGGADEQDYALAAYCINQMDGKLICKEDSSISCYGFEMVTYPTTYNYFKKTMPAWENILKKCDDRGFSSGARVNTGMHIHINRPWFGSEENIDRMLYLFEGFWENILKFSGRNRDRASEWASRYVNPISGKCKKADVKEKSEHGGRYRAVNLCNSNTVEIRIFNGTLDKDQFFANVELIKRLMDIITTYSEKDFYDLTWNKIVNGDDNYSYLKLVGNQKKTSEFDKKLSEYFEEEIANDELAWKKFPVGTAVHLNIREGAYYAIGANNDMRRHNGEWVIITEESRAHNYGGLCTYDNLFDDVWAYSMDMFDDYILPKGTELTVDIPVAYYRHNPTVSRTMFMHSGEVRKVREHKGKRIYLERLKDAYSPLMFKELAYIESTIRRDE